MPRSTEATKAVAAWYLPDARFLPAMHAVLSGPALIEPFPAGLFANGVTGRSLRLFGAGCDGKLVHGAANWTATTKDADRAPQAISGIATDNFERQADRRPKLKLHTFN
jgi:ketosteroid isomerase-like protein